MNPLSYDSFHPGRAEHLCPCCGSPDLPGVSCLCVSYEPLPCCLMCGSDMADPSEASCPSCRDNGRVEDPLVSMLDAWDFREKQAPPNELRAEEPLPTVAPVKHRSWRPAAA